MASKTNHERVVVFNTKLLNTFGLPSNGKRNHPKPSGDNQFKKKIPSPMRW